MSRALKWVLWTLGTLVVLVFVITLGQPWVVMLPFQLVLGWIGFLQEVFPEISWRWAAIAEALGVVAVLGVGTHLFLGWLWRQVRAEEAQAGPWLVRWSVSLVGFLVLLFCATMATVGLGHHVGWLATSREPLLVSSRLFTQFYMERDNERLCEYALNLTRSGVPYGRLMQELLRNSNTQDLAERLIVLRLRGSGSETGFVVFSRDPLMRARGGGARCGDGLERATAVESEQLPALLAEQGFPEVPGP